MSTDIGVVKGLIELQDDFTSRLGLAGAALANFSKENQQSLMAVAGVVGIVTAAFTVAAAAVYNLGQRGADVVDVAQTLEHFSGSAAAAEANLKALRDGVKGTVDDFGLMKDASHLLSAGVKLNAEDFGTLGSAAFVLQNRGLGGTKQMLELVSDAMVTGRTRALAMALGVVDAGNAEADYAKKLGVKVEMLSDTGKAEAKRIQIMQMLKDAVKDAGVQERDFGEQIEFAKAKVANWMDEVAKAISLSPALAAGMKAIEASIGDAFGADPQASIDAVLELIKKGVLLTIDFGLATIEAARMVNMVWSGIKVSVLGVEFAISLAITALVGGFELLARAANKMKLIPDGAVESIKAVRVQMVEMTDSFSEQGIQAAAGVVGHSAFDRTLDKLGGTLFQVRDAVEGAAASQEKANVVVDIAAKNVATLAAMHKDHIAIMVDQQKVQDALVKSTKELSAIQAEYTALMVKNHGSSQEAMRADIEATFQKQVGALEKLDPLFKQKYAAYRAIAHEATAAVGIDWDSIKDKSISAQEELLAKAQATYLYMANSGNFFRADVDAQRAKVQELADALRGMGAAAVAAHAAAAAAAANHTKELEAQAAELERLKKLNREMGGSITYDLTTDEGIAYFKKLNPMAGFSSGMGDIKKYFEKHTIQDALRDHMMDLYAGYTGPRMASGGTSPGGMTLVGEAGPEIVNLPRGAQVFPTGTGPAGGGSVVTNHIYVNGTAADVARKVSDQIMRTLKSQRQFGAA